MVVEESLKDEAAGSGTVSRGERDRGGDSRR